MPSIPAPVANFLDRVGWTFVQALAGSVVSAGAAASLSTFDYRAALAGGASAALLCALKVLAVSASSRTGAEADAPADPEDSAPLLPLADPEPQEAVAAPPAPLVLPTLSTAPPTFTFSPSARIPAPTVPETPAEQTAAIPVIPPAPPAPVAPAAPMPLSTEAVAAQSADRRA